MNELNHGKAKLQFRWLSGPVIGLLIVAWFAALIGNDLWHRTANGATSWTDCYHYWEGGGANSRLKTLPNGKTECSLPNGKTFVD